MYNTAFFHIVVAFLALVKDQLKQQTIADLNNKTILLTPETLYVKKEISGGGIINLIDSSTLNSPGVSNFDKNALQTGRILVFDQICVGYKSDSAAGKEGALSYNAAAPAELQNAILRINQNGKKVLELPFIDVHNLAAGQNRADQYTQLKALGLLVDDKTIEVQLIFPTGVTLAAGTHHYVSVSLSGLQTVSKS